MITVLLAFLGFTLAMALLGLGVLAGRPSLRGSCGGLNQIPGIQSECGGTCANPCRERQAAPEPPPLTAKDD